MWYVGIDWSDQALDFHLRTADGEVLSEGRVKPTLEGVGELFGALEAHALPTDVGIAIETAHGAWVQALLDRGYRLYPVNPKTAEAFRQALSAAGNKSDRIDCKVLAMFLAACHQELHPLRPDDPEIVSLRMACEDRVRLVEEHTAKLNELKAILKIYYPAFLAVFSNLDSQTALAFLRAYPTQEQMRALSERRFRSWLKRQGYSRPERVEAMVAALTGPVLPVAGHLQEAKAPLILYLAGALRALQNEIAERQEQIGNQLDRLPEADWVRSLPGAGPVLGPALLACVGRDPGRFPSVADARALMGTAPVTKSSGASRVVYFRIGCWKFARRTLQLFADHSRNSSAWAQSFYESQRASGHGHYAALRALAHKWLKIILAMKQTGTCYEEERFINSQRRYLSKLPLLGSASSAFSPGVLT